MVLDDGYHRKRKVHAPKNLSADHRMHFCLFELSRGQRARLVQNVIGHGELANVMQQGFGLASLHPNAFEIELVGPESRRYDRQSKQARDCTPLEKRKSQRVLNY